MNVERTNTANAAVVLSLFTGLAYLLPFRFYPYASFYNDALVIFGITVAYVWWAKNAKNMSVRVPWIFFLPCVLATILIVQAVVLHLSVGMVALAVVYLLFAGLSIILGASLTVEDARPKVFSVMAWCFLVVGLLSVLLAAIQLFSLEGRLAPFVLSIKHNGMLRPFANLGQPNHLALLLCMSLAATWYLFQWAQIGCRSAIFAAVWLIFGLALAQSRLGWVVLPAFFCLSIFANRVTTLRSTSKFLIVGLLFFYILWVIALPYITSTLLGATVQSISTRVGSTSQSERLVLFQEALRISLMHPWFGAGWYQFGIEQVNLATAFPPGPYSRYAHNLILNFAAELGWPITLFFVGVSIYWVYVTFMRRTMSKELAFSLAFLLPVLVHSMVEFPLWYGLFLMPTAFVVGAASGGSDVKLREMRIPAPYAAILFICCAVGLIVVSSDFRRVVAGYQTLNLELLGLRFQNSATNRPARTLFPQFYDYFEFAKEDNDKVRSLNELHAMEQMSTQFAYAPVLTDMSMRYARNGYIDEAVREMTILQKIHRCEYGRYYNLWKEAAYREAEKYAAVFSRLSIPEKCNS